MKREIKKQVNSEELQKVIEDIEKLKKEVGWIGLVLVLILAFKFFEWLSVL